MGELRDPKFSSIYLNGAPKLEITNGHLKVENVSFSYLESGGRHVVSNISFEAHRGETIGIIGQPGSGKTTLMHLLPRFYDPSGGSISIDGQDIRNVTLSSLRKAVTIVQQDSFFFTTSIENNFHLVQDLCKHCM